MKIVLWGINYAPESTGIAPFNRDLCEYLAGQGHRVSAVTAFPYYPLWRKRAEDRGRIYRRESHAGVTIHRCWCYVPARVTTLRRIAHELSFCVLTAVRLLTLPRADVYFVVSPPLALGFFAWVVTRLKRSRFVFHVQDLQPDAAVGLGMLKRGWLVRGLYALERFAYAKAALVSGISVGMMTAFRDKGVPPERRTMFPNWLREGSVFTPDAQQRILARRQFAIDDQAMLAVYAGNLGRKQSLEILGEVAALLGKQDRSRPHVRMIIAGDGAGRADLERVLREAGSAEVELLPLLSDADYGRLLAAADVALITQAAGTGQFFFPSKLLSVLAAGLPVVAVADDSSELAGAVQEGGFGGTVKPGDGRALTELLQRLARSPDVLRGWATRTGWVQRFAKASVLPTFENTLAAIGADGRLLPPKVEIPAKIRQDQG